MNKYSENEPKNQLLSQDLEGDCLQHMADNGLELSDSLITDGKIHRYSVQNQRKKPDEWYVAHMGISSRGRPYLICSYGSWSQGRTYIFKSYENTASSSPLSFTLEDRIEFNNLWKKKRLETEAALVEIHDKAAEEAREIWEKSFKDAPTQVHLRYIKAKGITPTQARFGQNPKGYPSIIIPLCNVEDQIRSVQFISMDEKGESYKKLLRDGEKRGNFHTLGKVKEDRPIFVVEGYATGVSVYNIGRETTVIAFDSGNIAKVVENLKKKFPNNPVVIAGDNDSVGKEKAHSAAKKFGCKVIFPEFPKEKSLDKNGEPYSDFNDLQQVCGIDEVKRQLNQITVIPSAQPAQEVQPVQEDLKKLTQSLLEKDDPCKDFKISHLPKTLGDYVASICETTSAHPIMVTSAVLTTISAFVGKRLFISNEIYFQNLYPNLWLLNVTTSGQFKTTALNKGSKIALDRSKGVNFKIKGLREELDHEIDPIKKKEIEAEIAQASLEDVVLPNKITGEALFVHLSKGHRGVILISEFGPWLQNFDKSHNNDLKGIFTELYDVPPSQ